MTQISHFTYHTLGWLDLIETHCHTSLDRACQFVTFVPVSNINCGKNHEKNTQLMYVSMCWLDDVNVYYLFQTAETIMKHNRSCSGLQLVCDALLKEKVSGISSVWFYSKKCVVFSFFHEKHFPKIHLLINRYAWVIQSRSCCFPELRDSGGEAGAGREGDGRGSGPVVSGLHPSEGGDSGAGEAATACGCWRRVE